MTTYVRLHGLLAILLSGTLACATGPAPYEDPPSAALPDVAAINESLLASLPIGRSQDESDYTVGAGDLLEIRVFQAGELDRTVRVRRDGSISLPLVGRVLVERLPVPAIEAVLAAKLGERYLQDPQISVLVLEHRSKPVAVHGAVNAPGIYYLRESRTLVEVLSEAGGLSEGAGTRVQLSRKHRDRESGTTRLAHQTIDVESLVAGAPELNLELRGGDRIHVPQAGVIYVQGAVAKPGVYMMQGQTNVLRAVAVAGGTEFSASTSAIEVVRANGEVSLVDFDAIRSDPRRDLLLGNGDVVVVRSSPLKLVAAGFWKSLVAMFNLSTGI